jgi:hypothetical protein
MQRQIVMFDGIDASGNAGLWETNGTAAGMHKLAIAGADSGVPGFDPQKSRSSIAEVLFDEIDANEQFGL